MAQADFWELPARCPVGRSTCLVNVSPRQPLGTSSGDASQAGAREKAVVPPSPSRGAVSVSPRLGMPGRGLVGSCAGAGGTQRALSLGLVSRCLGDILVWVPGDGGTTLTATNPHGPSLKESWLKQRSPKINDGYF